MGFMVRKVFTFTFLRAKAGIARISYGNPLLVSVRHVCHVPVPFQDFGLAPYDSLDSLVFRDKISCRWVKGIPTKETAK